MKRTTILAVCIAWLIITGILLFAAKPAEAEIYGEEWQGYTAKGRGVVLCESLTLREAPEQSTRFTSMPYGASCDIMETSGGWYGVSYADSDGNRYNGWVRSAYMLLDPELFSPDQQTPVYAYPSLNAKCVGLLDAGGSYPIIAEYDGFLVISLRGASGFVKAEHLRSPLQEEYEQLCDERGGFFKWTLEQKMEFANSLPSKLQRAYEMKQDVPSSIELNAIAAYGFCLPPEGCLSQKEALDLAVKATGEQFNLPIGWENPAEVYYSFFSDGKQNYTWRVIFWKMLHDQYSSGLVDLNAVDGRILRVESNGSGRSFEEYIPYVDRL